jgi:hypothetical protein
MKKISINLTVAALTFIIGIVAALGYQYLYQACITPASPITFKVNRLPQISNSLRPEMIEVKEVAHEPLKVLGIRLAEGDYGYLTLLIDVENTSDQRVAYFSYELGYFNDCANPYLPYATIGITPPNGTNDLPLDMALKPKQKVTVELALSGGSYQMMMAGRKERNCPNITKTELFLSQVVFSNLTVWERRGAIP